MQITDLYQTKIECSTYNANIDSTDTVITVSLIDFNGNAVTGKSVTLTCDKGYFNKKGSTAISGTTTKSITLNTDSNGQITGTWTASEWGLCTFSANTISTQICVTGFKKIQTGTNYTIYQNDNIIKAKLRGTFTMNANNETTLISINKNLNLQDSTCHHYATPGSNVKVYFQGNNINCFNSSNNTSVLIFAELTHIIL